MSITASLDVIIIGSAQLWLMAAQAPTVLGADAPMTPLPISTSTLVQPPISAQQAIVKSRVLAEAKHYEEALLCLADVEAREPNNLEIKLAIVRVLSWQGRYAAAEQKLASLDSLQVQNLDVALARGYLAYYQADYLGARGFFQHVLSRQANHAEAIEALARVEQAAQNVQAATRYPWQLDLGYENSQFSRRPQRAWDQEFLQLTHVSSDHKQIWYGKLVRWQQFETTDTELELNLSQRWGDKLQAFGGVAFAKGAEFRPENRLEAGLSYRLLGPDDGWPVWLSLDGRSDRYADLTVQSAKLAVRVEPLPGWGLLMRSIWVQPEDQSRLSGYEIRVDRQLRENLLLTGGFAQAPDTQAGETIDTTSWYGSLVWQISARTTARLGYGRDDRENAYIKQTWNLGFGYRF